MPDGTSLSTRGLVWGSGGGDSFDISVDLVIENIRALDLEIENEVSLALSIETED